MTYGTLTRCVGLCALVAACGGNEAKPIAKIDADDLRAEQVRERTAGAELAPMLSEQPGAVIYDPPPNLSKLPPDSAAAARTGVRDTSSGAVRRDSSAAGTSGASARDTSRRSPNS